MTAIQHLTIREGDTFSFNFGDGSDLTGHSAVFSVAPTETTVATVKLDSKKEATYGTIVVNVDNTISISMTPAQTRALPSNMLGVMIGIEKTAGSKYINAVYTLRKVASNGAVSVIAEGRLLIIREIN